MSGEKRYEIIDGERHMVPSPNRRHQDIIRELGYRLYEFVKEHELGKIYLAPFDVILSDEDIVQPDILFVSKEREGIITDKNIEGPPDLVIEIISDSSREIDRTIKRKLYAKYGLSEYWIIDPDDRSIEVLSLKKEGYETLMMVKEDSLLTSPLVVGLEIPLKEIF
jgi:Uma2 family endonuclease